MSAPLTTLSFSNLSSAGIDHGVTTRLGGVSKGKYKSLNLAFHVGDDPTIVLENRASCFRSAGFSVDAVTIPQQTHSSNVAVCNERDRGRGARDYETALPGVDGLVTSARGLCLLVLSADCAPILMFDPVRQVIAAVHAGRVGTGKGIVANAVKAMEEFGSKARNILVGIGPTISAEHYPVAVRKLGDFLRFREVEREIAGRSGEETINLDLTRCQIRDLLTCGVARGNIEVLPLCTFSNPTHFYSERRDGAPTGRFGTFISLGP